MGSRLEDNKIGHRYAKALFDDVLPTEQASAVLEELTTLESLLVESPEVLAYLGNPVLPLGEKLAWVQESLIPGFSQPVARIVTMMVENHRASALPALVSRYRELLNTHQNIGTAEVITATKIDERTAKKIQKALQALYGYQSIVLQRRVDPGILGGVIVKLEDKVIDGSYAGKLDSFRKQALSV